MQSPYSNPDTVVIKNLGIVESYFYGSYNSAAFIGMSNSSWEVKIENSYTNSRVIAYDGAAGGFAGFADKFILKNCYNAGAITGTDKVGGIVGYLDAYSGELVNVYNVGKVTATSTSIYGKPVVGYNGRPNVHENVFYLGDGLDAADKDSMGIAMSLEQFKEGAVVYLLRNYKYEGLDGSFWGQEIGIDDYPTLGKALTGDPKIDVLTLTLHTYDGDAATYPSEFAQGYMFRLPLPTREGYTFHGWFDNESFTGDSIAVIPDSVKESQEFWALFRKVSTVTYELDGGVIDSGRVDAYTEGIGAHLPKYVSRNGYVFSGWYAASDFSGHATDTIRTSDTGDKTFYAKWFKKETPKQDENGCYEISNAAELYGFSAIVKGTDGLKTPQTRACGKLTKDIVVNKLTFKEDGSFDETNSLDYVPWNPIDSFAGKFDGQGHTVSGLFYNDTSKYNDVGLFKNIGAISEGDTVVVKNVGIESSYLRANGLVGGIVAYVQFSGRNGLVLIQNCYNATTLRSTGNSVGGIVAYVFSESQVVINNCYNVGDLLGSSSSGGILGANTWADRVTLLNCMGLAPVKNFYNDYAMALAGGSSYYAIRIVNSYYLSTSGHSERGGVPASAEQVKNGSLAYVLRYGTYGAFDGAAWGQNVGTDPHPVLSGEVKNAEVVEYKVTFHTFEGDTAKYFDAYMPGFERTLPETVRMENAEFLGWYMNEELGGSAVTAIPKDASGDMEFWAKINKVSEVEFVLNGGKIDSGLVETYTEGVGAQLPWRVSRDSSIFAGWYDNEELSGKPVAAITTEDTGDKTYYAAWFKMKMPSLDETDGCYAISDAAELYGFAAFVSGRHKMSLRKNSDVCGKLTEDIVINRNVLKDGELDSANVTTFLPWEPILTFGGDFLGNGHKISGLFISRDSTMQGFFATANTRYDSGNNEIPIVVRDVAFEDAFIYGTGVVGGVFAKLANYRTVSMTNVSFDGRVESKIVGYNTTNAGGLVGESGSTLTLDSCKNMAKVYGKSTGGLVGQSSGTLTISNSANLGEINSVKDGYAAGLAAYVSLGSASITNSYNVAPITGASTAAGLIGYIGCPMNLTNSYNTGDIAGLGAIGGLVGSVGGTTALLQSYNTGSVTGTAYGVAVGGLVAKVSATSTIANSYNLGEISSSQGNSKVAGIVGQIWTSNESMTTILNSYSMVAVTNGSTKNPIANKFVSTSTLQEENNFYLAVEGLLSDYGIAASAEAFVNDSVADALHAYVQKDGEGVEVDGGIKGTAWIQGEENPELLSQTVFTITFLLNDGTLENAPVSYEYGEGLSLPVPTRKGFEFKGWYTTKFFEGETVTEISEKDHGDKIFYAKWQVMVYQVTVEVNNSKWGIVTGLKNDGRYDYGTSVTLKAEANQGYTLNYWGDDVTNNKTEISFVVVGDTTVVANFGLIEPESSSSVESSSSAEPPVSSSSEIASSSSEVQSSSSEVQSSSSVAPQSSSSSKPETSSSEGGDALPGVASVPQFSVAAVGRDLHVTGARVGSAYAVFDLQGRVLRTGTVDMVNFAVPMERSGRFLVRIGTQVRQVIVR